MTDLDLFRQAIEQTGLTPPESIVADGLLHRFASNGNRGDKAGWFIFFNDGPPIGVFGDWRTGFKKRWCGQPSETLTPAERARRRVHLDAMRRQRAQDVQRRQEEAAQRAQDIWASSSPAPDTCPYLVTKGIRSHGLRESVDGCLLVPILIDGELTSLQFIDARCEKRFLPGGKKHRGSFTIGEVREATIICCGEGVATMASVREATGYPVVVAFDAGNLRPVAELLRQQFPTATILVCGDNDLYPDGKPNTGLTAATAAAAAIDGVLVMPELDGKKCDFNDLAQARGLDAVRAMIEQALPERASPRETTATAGPATFQRVTAPTSFISTYMDYAAQRTDAPLESHEALAFGILSALAGPTVRLPIATQIRGWGLALWILYLVNSTAGRKSTVLDLALDVVKEILGETALIHWEGSPQGLLQRLQTRDGQTAVFTRDEYAGLLAGMNRGGHLAGLSQLLIKGFDGSVLENVRTRKRGADGEKHSDTDRVENPYLVQFAAAPWDAFTERATLDNVLDGFLPRFNIVTGSAAGRELPMLTDAMRLTRTALLAQAKAYYEKAQAVHQVVIAKGVLKRQWALEQAYLQRASASARPDAAGPALKRLADTALKLAALLAIEDVTGTVLSIHETHFETAAQITDRWTVNTLRLIQALGRTTFQKDCEAVHQSVMTCPSGLPLSTLYRTHRRLRERDFKEILSALETQEQIVIEKVETGRGRPPIMVRPGRAT